MKLEFSCGKKVAAIVCAIGIVGGALAQTRTLVTPADSVSAGGKTLTAIAGVCTASNGLCATTVELKNRVDALYCPTGQVSSGGVCVAVASSGGGVLRAWTTYFVGQSKTLQLLVGKNTYVYPTVRIDSNGVFIVPNIYPGQNGYIVGADIRALIPELNTPIGAYGSSFYGSCSIDVVAFQAAPILKSAFDQTPGAWTASVEMKMGPYLCESGGGG